MKSSLTAICLTLALSLGTVGAAWGADFQKGVAAYNAGDYATALREWTSLAKQGNASAQFFLGYMYGNGEGVAQDDKTAVKWWTLAAEQGNTFAQYNLGLMYDEGKGVLQDYVRAHMWWNIAASNGHKVASRRRDDVTSHMTPADISKAQNLARECVRKKYKDC